MCKSSRILAAVLREAACVESAYYPRQGILLSMFKLVSMSALSLFILIAPGAYADSCWGRLADPCFVNQRIKATYFFSGQSRDGSNPYGCTSPAPLESLGLNTRSPIDPANLNWFNDTTNRDFALNQMVQAGINVVSMSSWGERFVPCATNHGWGASAPMQTSPTSHDELFSAAVGKRLLIVPFIESRGEWNFMDEFPRWVNGQLAPGTVSQITEFVHDYLQNAAHPEWANKWARMYDRNGIERYAIGVIHAASNRLSPGDDLEFAAGFDAIADLLYTTTGVKVGFLLDITLDGVFSPTPERSGSFLAGANSILGIQCFFPERFSPAVQPPGTDEPAIYSWKRDFSNRWFQTGIPFLADVSPGYDGHIVFTNGTIHGYNAFWTSSLTQLVTDFGQAGMVYNSWNGYTEGMVAVPTREDGNTYYLWLQSLNANRTIYVDKNYSGTEFGTQLQPFRTVTAANTCANDGDRIQIQTGSYNEALTFKRKLGVVSSGGSVIVGR